MARCPSCLGDATRLALHGHLECAPFHAQSRARLITGHTFTNGTPIGDIVCQRKLYECTVSGVFIYLPLFNTSELETMYRVYDGQNTLSLTHFRPNEQAAMIASAMQLSSWRGPLHIVEAGCAGGHFLAVLAKSHLLNETARAVTSVNLSCFEADPKMAPAAQKLLGQVQSMSKGWLQARVVRSLFTGVGLQPASVDLVSSSHVLEHVTDPCTYVQMLRTVLRPRGYVFTELPLQSMDHKHRWVRGLFHATFWSSASYNAMMERSGFTLVAKQIAQHGLVVRQLHRLLPNVTGPPPCDSGTCPGDGVV